jgi:arsenite methyltransferase
MNQQNGSQQITKPNYGVDAPGVVAVLFFGGVAALLAATIFNASLAAWSPPLLATFFNGGLACLLIALLMYTGSKFWKLQDRNEMLTLAHLHGDERVLDVGCGRGMILNAFAQKLQNGKAIGIDIWQTKDQSGNSLEAAKENVRRTNTGDNTEIVTGDMRKLPFADGSFDVVTSSLAIHNVPSKEDRATALREIVRVLKPGGKIVIMDFIRTGEYLPVLEAAGIEQLARERTLYFFPSGRIISGQKR